MKLDLIKLNATSSTNNYLKKIASEELLLDGTVVCAKHQTKGRGQFQNSWKSTPGKDLTFSIFKRFSGVNVAQAPHLSFLVSLAIVNVLEKFQITELKVKWPNDIMSCNKKIAGILIENQLKNQNIASSVIGIGLNVNETDYIDLPKATSMCLNTNKEFVLNKVLIKVSQAIVTSIGGLIAEDFQKSKKKYIKKLYRKDVVSSFKTRDETIINGIIRDVNDLGNLILETENENRVEVTLKELKLLS